MFIADVLIALAVMDAVLGQKVHGRQTPSAKMRSGPPVVFIAFFSYLLLRAMLSTEYVFTFVWLRDYVPFLYSGLAFLSAWSLARANGPSRAKTMKLIWAALIFHLLWTSTVRLGGLAESAFPQLPGSGVNLFSVRPDIDMAVLSVTAALLLRRLILGENKFWGAVALALTLVTTLGFHSRAGLMSLALALLAAYVVSYASAPKDGNKRVLMVLAFPVILAVGVAAIAQTTPGERLIASVFNTHTGGENELNAQGTERARQFAWSGVADWTFENDLRGVFGSGFGNNFLEEAGVLAYLEGTTYDNVRSPHNWLVGVLARTGVVGVALALVVLASVVRLVARNRGRVGGDELMSTASFIFLATLPIAMFGVVLEAPFGAIPFWWAVGILHTMRGASPEVSSGLGSRIVRAKAPHLSARHLGSSAK
ncbi:O-antigen ligase family protein [Arthrobacter sedimenti]|uniref:O-antigen ligase family protein n=1 Tax=Arthrobacter sedimenti TaxID=2694931 RepID=UPI001421ECF3|nr:O-antigen ligase family protein [Arthrobacter sedimenti]